MVHLGHMSLNLRTLILGIALLGVIFFAITSFGKNVVKNQIGDLGPAFGPVAETAPQVVGENADARLTVPGNFSLTVFSKDAPGARDLQFSPEGTLLVSLKNAGKVIALPDANSDGVADKTVDLLSGLKNPHGLAFRDGKLFVAEERQVSRYLWDEQNLTATFEKKIADLPGGGAGHVTRSLVFDNQGNLYISTGSTCNVCDEKDDRNAAVLITNANGEDVRLYSTGLRNAVFLTLRPDSDQVWVTENSRDRLGDDLPPDELNILQANANYGWPYCYGLKVRDNTFGSQPPAYCDQTLAPVVEIPAHSAALGLTFIDSPQFPTDWQGDVLVAYHGSWNRSVPTGYKVVRFTVDGDQVSQQTDFLTGFLQNGQSIGRPVDVTFDSDGSLYVSDDKAGIVYLITAKP